MTPRRTVLVVVAALALLSSLAAPAAPAASPTSFPTVERDTSVRFRASDGVVLTASLHRPRRAGPLPCLLTVTPYGREGDRTKPDDFVNEELHPDELAAHGYAVLVVDDRGTGDSGGTWEGFSRREQQDGYELVEWMARRPWCDGRVGMFGNSALGIMTWLVAELAPPHLRAIAPGVAYGDFYRDFAYPGGTAALEDPVALAAAYYGTNRKEPCKDPYRPDERTTTCPGRVLNSVPDLLAEGLAHPYDDAFWGERTVEKRIERVRVPALIWDGWADLFVRGALWDFTGLRTPRQVVIGPWAHEDPDPGLNGGPVTWSTSEARARFFDHWLKDLPNRAERDPAVRVYVVHEGWRTGSTWPLPETRVQTFHLHAGPSGSARSLNDGVLAAAAPGTEPVDPLPTTPAAGLTASTYILRPQARPLTEPQDQRTAEAGALTYTTAPLRDGLDVVGPIEARLWLTLAGTDATVVARLTDVAPDGSSTLVTTGWLRATHRALDTARSRPLMPYHAHTAATALPVTSGQPLLVDVEVWPAGWRFEPGHRLRLDVALADLPHQQPDGGAPAGFLLHDRSHPSALLAPVVPAAPRAPREATVRRSA